MKKRGKRHYHLTLAEQETVILWNNELDSASVYTHDQRLISKLKVLSQKYPEQYRLERRGPQRAVTYTVPKKEYRDTASLWGKPTPA